MSFGLLKYLSWSETNINSHILFRIVVKLVLEFSYYSVKLCHVIPNLCQGVTSRRRLLERPGDEVGAHTDCAHKHLR